MIGRPANGGTARMSRITLLDLGWGRVAVLVACTVAVRVAAAVAWAVAWVAIGNSTLSVV